MIIRMQIDNGHWVQIIISFGRLKNKLLAGYYRKRSEKLIEQLEKGLGIYNVIG